jgi:hypothetical protein
MALLFGRPAVSCPGPECVCINICSACHFQILLRNIAAANFVNLSFHLRSRKITKSNNALCCLSYCLVPQEFIFLMAFGLACLALLATAAVICVGARGYAHPKPADLHMQQLQHRAPVYAPYIERGISMVAAAASRPGKRNGICGICN